MSILLRRQILRRAAVSRLLHILVDRPTHQREPWGTRPFWPLSDWSIEGIGWADLLSLRLASRLQRRSGSE